MKRAIKLGVWVSILGVSALVSTVGNAQEETDGAAPEDGVRRDPAGVTGVSPFWEAVNKGDSAFIAGDYDEAKTHFESAIKDKPQNPLGHTRVAQALLAKGELDAAAERLESALGFANRLELRAKILFLQADTKERQIKLALALQSWKKYQALAGGKAAKAAKTKNLYPETAAARIKGLNAAAKRATDYAAVKERIAKREAEIEAKARSRKK